MIGDKMMETNSINLVIELASAHAITDRQKSNWRIQ